MRRMSSIEPTRDEPNWQLMLALQSGARTLSWVNWWEGRAHVVTDANNMTRLSRRQRTLDGEPDLIDMLREKLGAIE